MVAYEKLYIHSIYLYLINMNNIQEFEVKWKEAIEKNGSDTDFYVSMAVAWIEEHAKDIRYFDRHCFVNYEIVDSEKVKLIGDNGETFVVPVCYIVNII